MVNSSKLNLAVNQLANLYIRAYYAYGWVRDIFQKDQLLQKLTAEFLQKAEAARVCCQNALKYMFENGIPFVLLDSTGKFDLDLSKVFSLEDEIKETIDELMKVAEDPSNESLKTFLQFLRQENGPELPKEEPIPFHSGPDNQNLEAGTLPGVNVQAKTPERMKSVLQNLADHKPSPVMSSPDSGIEEAGNKMSSSVSAHSIKKSGTLYQLKSKNSADLSNLLRQDPNPSEPNDSLSNENSVSEFSKSESSSSEPESRHERTIISSPSMAESDSEPEIATLPNIGGSNYKIIPTNKTSLELEREAKERSLKMDLLPGKQAAVPEHQIVEQHEKAKSMDELEALKSTSLENLTDKTFVRSEGVTTPDLALSGAKQNSGEFLAPKSIMILSSRNLKSVWIKQIVIELNKIHPEIRLFITRYFL